MRYTPNFNRFNFLFDLVSYFCTEEKCENYQHSVVQHGAKQFVKGSSSTNTIEGFWSHFRRMISGCYHDVSDAHLQSYIDEAVFRWNTRKMSESERFAHMFDKSIGIVRNWNDIKVGLMVA